MRTSLKTISFLATLAVLAVLAVLTTVPVAVAAGGFAVSFQWDGTGKCFDPLSPPFILHNVPAGTDRLRFTMTDLNKPTFQHGGGEIVYTGRNTIPRGAFSYRGPCPPHGHHRYRWTVDALDGTGHLLAEAEAVKQFPP
ncbi:MAG: hypothetical protein ACREFD_09370 [Stellaceae bacterium]